MENRDRAIEHLAEALHLLAATRNPGDTADVPVTIGGHLIPVTPKQAEALADAIDSMNAYLGSDPDAPIHLTVPETTVDPALVEELEQHCLGMDADFLMELAAQDPNSAVAAFDEIFEFASYEQIMREDGDL